MSDRIIELIKDEIATLSVRKNIGATSIFIQCPYHADNTPSGGINIDPTKTVPLGWFSCFGCKTSVPWNSLAKTLGLRTIKGRNQKTARAEDYIDPKRVKEHLLTEEEEEQQAEKDMKEMSFFDFPPEIQKWRGFKTSFLAKLGARYAYHDKLGEFLIWIPCMVNKRQVGYIKAYLEKAEGRISYVNSPGRWSRTEGLLFFDYAIDMMEEQGHKTIALVEGPRDALRCLQDDIPTVAILGTNSWSEEKRLLLEQAGVENLIAFMDGDDAGRKATKLVSKDVRNYMNFKYVNMWKYEKDWDPNSCPQKFRDKVRSTLTSF